MMAELLKLQIMLVAVCLSGSGRASADWYERLWLDGTPGASSFWPGHPPSYAFDPAQFWHPAKGSSFPHAIWFQFTKPQVVHKFTLAKGTGMRSVYAPDEYTIFGSNADDCSDSNEWNILATVHTNNFSTDTVLAPEKVGLFRCYGCQIHSVRYNSKSYTAVSNFYFFRRIVAGEAGRKAMDGDCKAHDDPLGVGYRGTKSITRSGQPCQAWDKQKPNNHEFHPLSFPDAGLDKNNFCRNPDKDTIGPWCYINKHGDKPEERYEECDIPFCDPDSDAELLRKEVKERPCSTSPCQNGATCSDEDFDNGLDLYSCACTDGYEGENCERDSDDCKERPCLNGGICTDGLNSYTCACADGYEGNNCETELDSDDCKEGPCLNGGICTDGLNSHTCACADGYEGNNCETDTDDCKLGPCQNGGNCWDGLNSYSCACTIGYAGFHCEIDIDDCKLGPCQNGGQCVDGLNSYTCGCANGYKGNNCEMKIEIPKAKVNWDCKSDKVGKAYRGQESVTKRGKPCQRWDSQDPHQHEFLPFSYPDAGLEGNFCRNPDNDAHGPWCHTTSRRLYDYCDIDIC